MPLAFRLVETLSDLQVLCDTITDETALAIDIEADSFHHYFPKICLVQISTRQDTYVVDPLATGTIAPLLPVLTNDAVKKVFHGADYDLRSLHREYGVQVENLFDTMVASQYLGEKDLGLAAALKKRFGVVLDKKFQKANWSKRPLPRDMLVYAAHDTAYLLQLFRQLQQELRRAGRLEWAEEEFRLLCRGCCEGGNGQGRGRHSETSVSGRKQGTLDTPLFRRFKGAGAIKPRDLAVLEQILVYRETLAMRQDRPPFKVFGNELVKELVQAKPAHDGDLKTLRGLPKGFMSRHGKGVLQAIKKGLSVPDNRLPSFPKTRRPSADPRKQARLKRLRQWRDKKASRLALDPGLVCNNALLEAMAAADPRDMESLDNIPAIKKWQKDEWGKEIVELLSTSSHRLG
jgi:ribonuclease D